jgi:hypothetical protein
MLSIEYRSHLTDDELACLDMGDCEGLARVIVRMRKTSLDEQIAMLLKRHPAGKLCELIAQNYSEAVENGRDLDQTHELSHEDKEAFLSCQRTTAALDSASGSLTWLKLSDLPTEDELPRKRHVA